MDAAQVIAQAAERAGADVYAPGVWDGDDASSVALVLRSDRRVVLTINADDLIYVLEQGDVWGDLYVYGYRAEEDVTDAAGVLRALSTEEGASVDPQGDGMVTLHAKDTADIPAAIVGAMRTAAQSTHGTGGTGGTVATLAVAGALGTWLAMAYGPALFGMGA